MKRKLKLDIGSYETKQEETFVEKAPLITIDNLNVHVERSVRERIEKALVNTPKEARQFIAILNATKGEGVKQVLLQLDKLEVTYDSAE